MAIATRRQHPREIPIIFGFIGDIEYHAKRERFPQFPVCILIMTLFEFLILLILGENISL